MIGRVRLFQFSNTNTRFDRGWLPIFGAFGYTMISIAALFSTTGAINSQLYPSIGATFAMAKDGTLAPIFGLKRRRRPAGTQGLVISDLLIIALAVLFDVAAVTSIGRAVALVIFVISNIAFCLVHPDHLPTDICDPGGVNHPGVGGRNIFAPFQQA